MERALVRPDGRGYEDLRDTIRIEVGVLDRADGSAYLEWGTTIRLAKVPLDKTASQKLFGRSLSLREAEALLSSQGEIGGEGWIGTYPAVRVVSVDKTSGSVMVEFPKPLWHLMEELKEAEVVREYLRGNKVYVAVYGPREPIPRHEASPYRAVLRYRYTMSPFSVPERKSPKPSRREVEISMVSRLALERVLFLEEFPMTMIDVFAEIISADAGTRVAALTATAVALVDAGVPMKTVPTALAVGRICADEEGNCTIVADLNKLEEDMPGAVDLPMVVLPGREEFTLLQMDGRVSKRELEEMLELGLKKAEEISRIQRDALLRKYERVAENE